MTLSSVQVSTFTYTNSELSVLSRPGRDGTVASNKTLISHMLDICWIHLVSRPFTIYQLASLVINELPEDIRKFNTKVIIIPDLLSMILKDPSVIIGEARPLVKDITDSLRFDDMSVIVSLNRVPQEYQMVLPTGENQS